MNDIRYGKETYTDITRILKAQHNVEDDLEALMIERNSNEAFRSLKEANGIDTTQEIEWTLALDRIIEAVAESNKQLKTNNEQLTGVSNG